MYEEDGRLNKHMQPRGNTKSLHIAAVICFSVLAVSCANDAYVISTVRDQGVQIYQHKGSGLCFPPPGGAFLGRGIGIEKGDDPFAVDYVQKGGLCQVVIEPVMTSGSSPDQTLMEEFRRTVQKYHEQLHSKMTSGPEERFAAELKFRGQILLGQGVLTSKATGSKVWQSSLVTFVIDNWNVTIKTLGGPNVSRPPAPLRQCYELFFAANGGT